MFNKIREKTIHAFDGNVLLCSVTSYTTVDMLSAVKQYKGQ